MNKTANNWKTAYKVLLVGLVVFALYFGAPVIGVGNTFGLVESMGCRTAFDYTPTCIIFGYDISSRVAMYSFPFLNLVITPIFFLIAFREILVIWVALIVFCVVKSNHGPKPFRVYRHSKHGFLSVGVGFSWPAMLFGVFWLMYKRLWLFVMAVLVVGFFAWFIEHEMEQLPSGGGHMLIGLFFFSFNLALWLWPAFKGNRWCEKSLLDQGYKFVGAVSALNPLLAVEKFQRNRDGAQSLGQRS